ncbi:transcriptional regulator [Pradoshia eiseniae]|uniref:Transcriptional regulator n=1 Tax=Pradoshia eiseniae TaxID=2064768 RepID=A0A2S7MWS9_9BACI|nr:metalloregulator ArsR/SmtB family transcription factor [Pradoshia eiseniae]PQD94215.1 transcriptional regulator [Pradoshia eiseniae]
MNEKDICEIDCSDELKVRQVQGKIQQENLSDMTQLFKALADENRTKIVYALCCEEELCVCDLSNIIAASVANTSHHLRNLYKQGIVKYRKQKKLVYYSLDDDHIKQIMMVALAHKKEVKENG